ncbi:hypothetical protein AGMMS50268_09470 [Spirochaetia bacterium]|nr:hypothetical protein AGMMS50268_09470 [Spirochaetia bacterium]
MRIVAKKIKEEIDKFIQLVTEHRKDFRQNALLYSPAGDDSVPLNDERLILVKVDGTGRYVAVGTLTPSKGAKPGEKILFGRDPDGKVTSLIKMLNDGTLDISNEKDYKRNTKGNSEISGDGKFTMTIKGDVTFEGKSNVTNKAGAEFTNEAIGKYTIKGATVEIAGASELILKTIGSPLWCPNGTTKCYICGAPHGGPEMGITGLKGA